MSGCKSQTALKNGLVCDRISSNVQIFYLSQLGAVSEEDKDDIDEADDIPNLLFVAKEDDEHEDIKP